MRSTHYYYTRRISIAEIDRRGVEPDVFDVMIERLHIALDRRLRGVQLTKRFLNGDATLTVAEVSDAGQFIADNAEFLFGPTVAQSSVPASAEASVRETQESSDA